MASARLEEIVEKHTPSSTAWRELEGSLPRKLIAGDTIVHTRRPDAWARLSLPDAALLDFLRQGGKFSELSSDATVRKTEKLLSQPGTFEPLLKVSRHEPPRVRAMLGAFGEQIGHKPEVLRQLRACLNPFSKFDFGMLATLPNAHAWQAEENRCMRLAEHADFEQAVLRAADHFQARGLRASVIEKDDYI
jgi:hypothetical protein